ncbi:NADPH-dependent FMN reductase [Pseudolysinimonas sp.]|uniref:NADPH-dependent FMN reductase n=1 Tax=Pseudolysinimonas sp. TaxID=2680009 RepID=UPI003F82293B
MTAIRIGIIIGSTRPGRNGAKVAEWVRETAAAHAPGVEFELVDLADHPLPHFDEPISPARRSSQHAEALAWSAVIDGLDGFIFVTPEYNHSISGVLKNAIDYLYAEWNDKAAGIVSYGGAGGARAAEHLRLILGEVQIADVRQQVALSLMHDFEAYTDLRPAPMQATQVGVMVDQVVAWSGALRAVREAKAAVAA